MNAPMKTPVQTPASTETLRYGVADSPLCRVLAASTMRGVCAVLLGDDDAVLRAELRARFPAADLRDGGDAAAALAARVAAAMQTDGAPFDAPLDVRGTPFQRAVWEALRAVAAGSTVSYTELARRVGRPDAVRAVAQACAANPVAVVVPCHRAVRSDGSLSGYRWGVERKRALLAWERRGHEAPQDG
jgi:AraC family transcriptional regulator, regulatory protein of adaptative response / methylated-DNA-[protein]-cysteine methyltransferase